MSVFLPSPNPDHAPDVEPGLDDQELLQILAGYKSEGENAREAGPNPRDMIWRQNWDLYWGRYDFSKKAAWQSKHVMPEVPQFVDRWAAAMREALSQAGRWFEAEDPASNAREFEQHIERLMNVLLARCGRTPDGHTVSFEAFFEDQMKLGSLMACCASVTWKEDPHGGYVAVETVDPQTVWFDPHGRNLYRRRTLEVDRHELLALADLADDDGEALYDREAIIRLTADVDEQVREDRDRVTGHGSGEADTNRVTIRLDEYRCDLIDSQGEVKAHNALIVVANNKTVIRGPEENPFWHERDWIVFSPMITVPMSVYGRSYLEDWADPARAFTEMTNLILDGTFTTAMKAFAMQPEALEDPSQVEDGIHPNKIFSLTMGSNTRDFMREIDLGSLPPEALTVWQTLKTEMKEGAKLNEIALGQVPSNRSEITATEIAQVQQSSSATVRSMARTLETRFLEPVLTLMYYTALQHMDFTHPEIQRELGESTAMMLQARREEFRERNIKFRVRGLSGLVDRQAKLRNLMSLLQVVSGNELLLREFLQQFAPSRVLNEIVTLFGIDSTQFEMTEQERAVRAAAEAEQQRAGGGQEQPAGQSGSPPAPNGNAVLESLLSGTTQ